MTYVSLLELIPGNRLVVGAGLTLIGSAAQALTVRFDVEHSRWRISALFMSGALSLAVLIVLFLGLLDSWEFASADQTR